MREQIDREVELLERITAACMLARVSFELIDPLYEIYTGASDPTKCDASDYAPRILLACIHPRMKTHDRFLLNSSLSLLLRLPPHLMLKNCLK